MIRTGKWRDLRLEMPRSPPRSVLDQAARIVEDIERGGWEALRRWSLRLDGMEPRTYTPRDMLEAWRRAPPRLRDAMALMASRVQALSEEQMPRPASLPGPLEARTIWRPIETVGVYAPGGRHPYPSTLIMCAVPARVAGVKRIAAASPLKTPEAETLMLAAAHVARVDTLLSAGGPQAVAALALGLAGPPADKIVGPGGPYVQAAKKLLHGRVGIDMVAGPTELVAISDGTLDPRLLALDLAAQAEHGPGGLSLLLDTDPRHLGEVEEQLRRLYRPGSADVYLAETESLTEALRAAEEVAPEHLLLAVEHPEKLLPHVRSAGAVSLGAPPALLDYTAGTNHVLPTSRWARWRGGLSVYDYLKPVYVAAGFDPQLARAAATLAEAEGLTLHAESIKARLEEES